MLRPRREAPSTPSVVSAPVRRTRRLFGFLRPSFVTNIISELQKVVWPSRGETRNLTLVERITQAGNLATERRADRYRLDPDDFLEADIAARRDGLEIVGIWHTHPDHPSRPSLTDLEAAWEGYSYVIVSVGAGGVHDTRSWRLAGDEFVEQSIEETRS